MLRTGKGLKMGVSRAAHTQYAYIDGSSPPPPPPPGHIDYFREIERAIYVVAVITGSVWLLRVYVAVTGLYTW